MPDEPTPEAPPQPPQDPAQIEALQAGRAQQVQLATREQYVRHCLAVLAPVSDDGARSYVELLERLQGVIAHELEEQQRDA